MEPLLQPLSDVFFLNTDLVMNSLDGLSETDAASCPSKGLNSARFLFAHMIDARYFLVKLLGAPLDNPHEETFREVTTMEQETMLPPLSAMKADWHRVSSHLESCLRNTAVEVLMALSPQSFPVADRTVLGGVAFLAQHESYHLGQLGLIRKALGHEGMSYDRKMNKRSDA
ncbi:MAG: DinB family protein [Planctomycetota bacterium]|jgi:uncharacterized damage-inducible protein DinB